MKRLIGAMGQGTTTALLVLSMALLWAGGYGVGYNSRPTPHARPHAATEHVWTPTTVTHALGCSLVTHDYALHGPTDDWTRRTAEAEPPTVAEGTCASWHVVVFATAADTARMATDDMRAVACERFPRITWAVSGNVLVTADPYDALVRQAAGLLSGSVETC